MTDRELNERLKSAVDHAAPDDLAAVLARCGTGKGNVIDMKKTTNTARRHWKKGLIAACLALVLIAGGGGGLFYQQAYAVASVISLDVNPSIELTVNKREKVLSCKGLNEEGITVLADMDGGRDLKGAKLDVAVNAIVGALVRNGYLDNLDSAILISVEDSDADRGARLQQELVASVDGVLQTAENSAAVLSQSVAADKALDARAQQNSISTGKAYLVDQIVSMNSELDFNALAALSVEELRDLIKIGAPDMPIGRDAALQAALDCAGLTREDAPYADVDPELDERTPYYEVELVIDGREQDYGVHAFTGEVIQGAKTPSVMNPGPVQPQADTPNLTEAETLPQTAAQAPAADGDIGEDAALATALDHAGLSETQVSRLKCERDFDDGRLEYEIEFKAGGYEYEYTIDAASGAILDHERDWDD